MARAEGAETRLHEAKNGGRAAGVDARAHNSFKSLGSSGGQEMGQWLGGDVSRGSLQRWEILEHICLWRGTMPGERGEEVLGRGSSTQEGVGGVGGRVSFFREGGRFGRWEHS